MSLAVQVNPDRVRLFNKGAMRAFFDANVGFVTEEGDFVGVFTIADNILFEKNEGGYFSKPFEQVRVRNGEKVLGEDGFPKKDAIVSKFFGPDSKPTKESYKFFDLLTEKAVEAFKTKETAPASKQAPVPASVGTSVGESEPGSPLGKDDDYNW